MLQSTSIKQGNIHEEERETERATEILGCQKRNDAEDKEHEKAKSFKQVLNIAYIYLSWLTNTSFYISQGLN